LHQKNDYSTDDRIDGMTCAADANVATATDKTVVIPGHGPVGNKSQLVEFRDMLVAIREKVSALKKEGKSIGEVVAAKPTPITTRTGEGFSLTASPLRN
jgi:hypothetical protein